MILQLYFAIIFPSTLFLPIYIKKNIILNKIISHHTPISFMLEEEPLRVMTARVRLTNEEMLKIKVDCHFQTMI